MRAWLAAVCVVAACGGGGAGTGDDDVQDDAAVDAPDGSVGPIWTTLIERNWQVEPTIEKFKCVRKRIEVDTYINGFRAKSPNGTCHELLTIATGPATPTIPNGSYDCDASKTDHEMLFAGGIATNDVVFPKGVAIKLPAGSYINLNLHLVNTSGSYMNGASGIEVLTIPASEVDHEADMMFAGTFDLRIPPTNLPETEIGSCTIPVDWNVVALFPQMHSFATHHKVKLRRAGAQTETAILDVGYSHGDQKTYPMQLALHPNDLFTVECTYVNNTNIKYPGMGYEIRSGETSIQEMCFTGFYKWPADDKDKYFCAPL